MVKLRLTCLLAAVLAVSCVNSIVPAASLHEPTTAYLVDHGRHASLILPSRHGPLVRYAYGDWRWYALSDEGLFQGMAALFWPTPGTLGRREIGSPENMTALRARIVEGADEILAIPVAADRVMALAARLDAIYREQLATRVYNPIYGLEFVHHPDAYSIVHQSNTVMVRWLEELGCEVRGPALVSRWRLEAP